MIYPISHSIHVPEGRAHDPQTFLTMEGYKFVKEYTRNGALWYVYEDADGQRWKAPGFGSPVFLTPYTDEG